VTQIDQSEQSFAEAESMPYFIQFMLSASSAENHTTIELTNEYGYFSPLETTMAVTRVRFPSPAPIFKNTSKTR